MSATILIVWFSLKAAPVAVATKNLQDCQIHGLKLTEPHLKNGAMFKCLPVSK